MNIYLFYFSISFFILTILHFCIIKSEKYYPATGLLYIPKKDSFKYSNSIINNLENHVAIISFFLNYNYSVVYSFVKCLNNVKFKGHIILFISRRVKFKFSIPKIHQIKIKNKYPYYSYDNNEFPISKYNLLQSIPIKCQWNTIRFYLLSIWLKYYYSKYEYFYFCDGRDILFQLNPSRWNYGKGVHLVLESDKVILKNSIQNIIWTKKFEMGDSIYDQHVINGGSIFGSSKEISLFVSEMINMLKILNLPCANDQGALNYFYYSHPPFPYPVFLDKQGYGFSLTLTDLFCDYFFTDYCNYKIKVNDSQIKNLDGTIPVILHGIDRWKNTKNRTRKKEYNDFIYKYYSFYIFK